MISLRSIASAGLCIAVAACSRSGPPSAAAGPAAGEQLTTTSPDGVRIAYHVYGHGDPAVVLIHGWACDSSYWRAQIADLASKYTTVTLDLAGHGASGRNRTDWSMANFGRDVAAVVERLPNRRIVLVGHLMGGPVALEAAPLVGDRLIGVIGVDTFTSLDRPPPAPQALEMQIAPFRTDFVGYMHRFVPQLFAKSADPAFVRKVADDMSREPPQIAIASLISLNTLDFGTLLPRIHVPIVAIDSDLGHTPAPDEARIRRIYPAFHAVMLMNPGHFLMLEDPQRFNPVLMQEIAHLISAQAGPGPASKELHARDGSDATRSPAS
ncbi:MAG: alpha/beta hydrolase [Steroidobacteraceae bacterium]